MSLKSLAAIFSVTPNDLHQLTLSCARCLSEVTAVETDGKVRFTCSGGCTEDELMGALAEVEPRFADWWLSGGLASDRRNTLNLGGGPTRADGAKKAEPRAATNALLTSAFGEADGATSAFQRSGPSLSNGPPEALERRESHESEEKGGDYHNAGLDSSTDPADNARAAGLNEAGGSAETAMPRHRSNGASSNWEDENEHAKDSETHLNGQVDVFRWKQVLYDAAKKHIEHSLHTWPLLPETIGSYKVEDFLITLDEQSHHHKPPSNLSEAEVDNTLREMALSLQKFYAPTVANGNDPDEGRHAIDLFDAYTASRAESREYTWGGLIRRGCSAVITGQMAAGKSTLLMCLARAWALGELFFGRTCIPSKTLVVCSQKEFEAWEDTIGFWQLKGQIYAIESSKVQFKEKREQADWFEREMSRLGTTTFILDTLFDFFGMPPNTSGDQNRIVMAEQSPILEIVKARGWSGIVSGHPPKGEANNPNPREPEEAFGGHTAWTAQHRMRMRLRRTGGPPALITGKGGYGDEPVFPEQAVMFDEGMRLVTLGGLWTKHLGVVALPVVIAALESLGGFGSMAKMVKETERSESFLRAGCRAGRDARPQLIWKEGKGRSTHYRLTDPNGNDVSSEESEWH